MYFGCAYYPEYWGKERYEEDARLMQEAGINLVRIGEFAWSRMEPEEGVFQLEWLHTCIRTLAEHGIHVLLCTPTATPPAWLTDQYPETLLTKSSGQKLSHGGRRHYCYTTEVYREHIKRLVETLSKTFSVYPSVLGWQIDNEPDTGENGICYCENCQRLFKEWLQEKYTTLSQLNERWKTGFWSVDYSHWRQIKLASAEVRQYSSHQLDTKRFASEKILDFVLFQANIIKENHPEALVSTNQNGGIFTNIHFGHLFKKLDIVMKDLYFDICTQNDNDLVFSLCRSFKKGQPFWITETGAAVVDYTRPPKKDQFRAFLWTNLANGGQAHVVFRWRTCLSGQEQELQGLLEHSGYPGHRYQTAKKAFLEMQGLLPQLKDLPMPKAEVAIIHDYEAMWMYQSSVIKEEIRYEENLSKQYLSLYRRNIHADILSPEDDFSGYKLILLPSLPMISDMFAKKLQDYISLGGVLFAQGQFGCRDAFANYVEVPGPDHLQTLFGVQAVGGMYLKSHVAADEAWYGCERDVKIGIQGTLNNSEVSGLVSTWAGDVLLDGAEALLVYTEDTYEGQPVLTRMNNAYYFCAMDADEGLTARVFDYLMQQANIQGLTDWPLYVEKIRRGRFLFLINHRDEAVDLPLSDFNRDGHIEKCIVGCLNGQTVHLDAFGVCVLQFGQNDSDCCEGNLEKT